MPASLFFARHTWRKSTNQSQILSCEQILLSGERAAYKVGKRMVARFQPHTKHEAASKKNAFWSGSSKKLSDLRLEKFQIFRFEKNLETKF